MMMMVVGKKQVRESWRPKQLNQTQFKLRPANLICATVSQLAKTSDQKLYRRWTTPGLVISKVGVPFSCQEPHLVLCLFSGLKLWGCYDRCSVDVPLTNVIPLAVIANTCIG